MAGMDEKALTMEGRSLIDMMAYSMIIVSALIFIALQFNVAPYGRYSTGKRGILIPSGIAWFIQELPAFLVPLYIYLYTTPPQTRNAANYVMMAMYFTHYFQRCFIYPFLIRGGKHTPLFMVLVAGTVCFCIGYLQGYYLILYAEVSPNWVYHPQFIIGVILFLLGFVINIHSDHILRNLRKEGETGYKIPFGGMFYYVSGANFFGEMLEWLGYAIACGGLPAFAFAVLTFANVVPRATHHHKWYLEKFKDEYPRNRNIIIPFIY